VPGILSDWLKRDRRRNKAVPPGDGATHLRSMLMDIADGALQERENALEAVEQLIYDSDKKMESLRRFNPAKVGEQMNYTMGLAKALSMVQKK